MNNTILTRFLGEPPVPKLPPKVKYDYKDSNAEILLSNQLLKYFEMLNPNSNRQVVVVCIGTDRSTGDCLGPLVGYKLSERRCNDLLVYGTLDDPIHAANINSKMALIAQYDNPLVIAIDASLGKADSVGYVTLAPGAVKPGAGVNKNLPQVGDVHFTGIVNVGGYMEYFVLQNTRLNVVMDMATTITNSIVLSWRRFQRKNLVPKENVNYFV